MSSPLVVRPAACPQFTDPAGTFCLVTDAALEAAFVIEDAHGYDKAMVVALADGETLQDALTSVVPATADILVVRPGAFVTSPDPAVVGTRRIAVMPCGSSPVLTEHIRYFLSVMERTDPAAQVARAERFFDDLENAASLRLVDAEQGTACDLSLDDPDLDINLQAGPLGPGEQQIVPAGEIGVLPMAITGFDATRRLALDGELTLRGWPIVHAGYDPAVDAPQAELFERLVPLRDHPVVAAVAAGRITACRPGDDAPATASVTAALEELLTADERYRTVWELGFGINTAMDVVPANCGLNEMYGADNGVVHIGLGLTPFTTFALTFLCPGTAVVDQDDRVLLGRARTASRRIKRTKTAGCGCH